MLGPLLAGLAALLVSAGPLDTGTPLTNPFLTFTAPDEVRCPVTGRPIDPEAFTYFRGRRVYFADAAAREQFLQAPTDFASALLRHWKFSRPIRVQVRCPVTLEPIRPAIHIELPAHRLYFSSPEARRAWFAADAATRAAYRENLARAFIYQTTCGTCNNPINPAVSRDLHGRSIWFCCTGCPRPFEQDPAIYLKQIDEEIAGNRAAFEKRLPDWPSLEPAPSPAGARPFRADPY